MSKKQLDALFREVISRDAAYESRILVSERPETPEIPALSRRRFENMLDRELGGAVQETPKKARTAPGRVSRILGRVLVASAACIVILFATMMSSEAVRGRVTKFLVSIGVDESTAASDACKMEHVMSDVTLEAIKKQLI